MRILAAQSPNFSPLSIDPEFLVLHYTACDLQRTLAIFADREKKVCAHFVLAPDGTLYDLGGFWDGPILQGAHAGVSRFHLDGKDWERLNTCSIGVEIVNLNGNLFPYTDAQYHSLAEIARHIAARFPKLADPARVVGHEHIAGFRGKVDPGREFEWPRFYAAAYAGKFPERPALVTATEAVEWRRKMESTPPAARDADFWSALSSAFESHYGQKA